MPDNTPLNSGAGGDVVRSLQRQAGSVKTQVTQLDIGGGAANAEVLVTAGQQPMAASLPVVISSNQTVIPVATISNSFFSTTNSTSVALLANAVFVGTSEDVTEYNEARVSVFADQASAVDGLQMQQSSNGTNWDAVDAYSIPVNSGRIFSVGLSCKFFRVVYNNNVTAQTAFRLQTKYLKNYARASSARPQDSRTNDNDFEEALSYGMGFDGTAWNRLRATIANGLLSDVSRIVAALPAGTNALGSVAVKGLAIATLSGSIAAAGTGTVGPADVAAAGNVTFTVKNTVSASAYAGAPVIVFEQSDDNVSWGPLMVTRADTLASASTFTLSANTAAGSLMFDASAEGVSWVRARVTTGPVTNALTVSISGGGMAFTPVVSVVTQPLTKAVQGASGITTQDLKDSGRTARNINLETFAVAVTTEALMTLSFSTDNGTVTTGTTFAVTAGKRYRLQSINATLQTTAGNTTAVSVTVRIRANNAGAAIITSPLQLITTLSGVASASNAALPVNILFPDGWEFVGGANLAITLTCGGFVATTAAPRVSLTITGYEY